MKRYFAKKSNDDTKPFEISVDDFKTSPLYQYEMVVWFIMGAKQSVSEKNILSVVGAEALYVELVGYFQLSIFS